MSASSGVPSWMGMDREAELLFSSALQKNMATRSAALAGEGTAWNGSKDEVNISEAARSMLKGLESSAGPSSSDAPSARMEALTRQGTSVVFEAHSSGRKQFSMGRAGEQSEGMFKLSGSASAGDAVAYTVTFAHKNGETQTFELDGNTAFTEDDTGNIIKREKKDKNALGGTEGQDILINLEDNTTVDGGEGDDIIFNVGRNSTLRGGTGNDVIMSMGSGVAMEGGAGDDAMAALFDTLHPVDNVEKKLSDQSKEKQQTGTIKGQPVFSQSVIMDGGDGNDNLLAQAHMYKSRISGGNGADTITANEMTGGTLDGGDGSDIISLRREVRGTTILGGEGNDLLNVMADLQGVKISMGDGDDMIDLSPGMSIKNSKISLGDGNDVLLSGDDSSIQATKISGGDGNDSISVAAGKGVEIFGGAGDDLIVGGNVSGSTISGGAGNDTIIGNTFADTDVSGDDGNDTIRINRVSGGSVNPGQSSGAISGGAGDDSITVNTLSGTASIDGGAGNDIINVTSSVGRRETTDMAHITGGSGDDTINVGNADTSVISGGSGADVITVGTANRSVVSGGTGGVDAQGRPVADVVSVQQARSTQVYQNMADASANTLHGSRQDRRV